MLSKRKTIVEPFDNCKTFVNISDMDAYWRQNPHEEFTLEVAAEFFPRKKNGKKVHVRSIQRWLERGCRGVLLAGRKSGNVWYTTFAAIEQFRAQLTANAIRARPSI